MDKKTDDIRLLLCPDYKVDTIKPPFVSIWAARLMLLYVTHFSPAVTIRCRNGSVLFRLAMDLQISPSNLLTSTRVAPMYRASCCIKLRLNALKRSDKYFANAQLSRT